MFALDVNWMMMLTCALQELDYIKQKISAMFDVTKRYQDEGNYKAALPVYQNVVMLRRVVLGEDHVDTLNTMCTGQLLPCSNVPT
jgi:hypothetical protein